jgi:hypothetical protein
MIFSCPILKYYIHPQYFIENSTTQKFCQYLINRLN